MSGHSKWATTKRQKEATDKKRAQIFTKLARSITVAAKLGGGDPETNFNLRLAITRAKAANMPKDNIERAIKRGLGKDKSSDFEEIIYEGFGPENIFIIFKVLTDNRNRAVAELKHLLNKSGGSLAAQGSVMWKFDKRGLIISDLKNLTNQQEEELIESGALDFSLDEDGLEIITEPNELEKVKKFLEDKNFPIKSSEISYLPKERQPIKNLEAWKNFLDKLDDLEDINEYYTNAN